MVPTRGEELSDRPDVDPHAHTVFSAGEGAGATAPSQRAENEDAESDIAPELPRQVGRYRVRRVLGEGGMGTVFEAHDEQLERRVAVKLLHGRVAERYAERLLREAKALARLSHPNVVQVYEVGEDEGQWFIAMELVAGRTLREWQQARPPWRECVEVYLQAGTGLAAAHEAGLVHRDFKPDNCIVDELGRPRVLDFGLVREADESSPVSQTEGHIDDEDLASGSLTKTGAVLGTVAYMPLEQLEGRPADARSDQFSFCVALYEALYGTRPFGAKTVAKLMLDLMEGRMQPVPKGARVPARLRRVLLRGLAARPESRWSSMDELLAQLRRLVAPRGRWWLALGLGGAGVAVAAGQYLDVERRCQGARAQLDGVWDETRKQAVEAAILGTELSYAPDTWVRVEALLDDYAQGWAESHTEACEATSVRGEQSSQVMDLRMGCLQQRRLALSEAVEALIEADPTRVQNAVPLVSGLPALARCDDVDALQAELPPPDDPAVAAKVEALREQLIRIETTQKVGGHDRALARVEEVMAEAEALDHPPILAEALVTRGFVFEARAKYAEAARDMERAYLLAAQIGHERVERRAVTTLVFVTGVRLAQPDAGLLWGKTALALARADRAEPDDEASVLGSVGLVEWNRGKLDEALPILRQALALEEKVHGPRHYRVARSLQSIGIILAGQAEHAEALEHFRRALDIQEEALGAQHPATADPLSSIGLSLSAQGELDEALVPMRRALDLRTQLYGDEHPNVASSLHDIGEVLLAQGKQDEAVDHFSRALATWDKTLGPSHPLLAYSLVGLAQAALAGPEPTAALQPAQRAVSIREGGGVAPSLLADARFVLARALRARDEDEGRARELGRQALEAYVEAGAAKASEQAEVRAWLSAID